MNTKTTQQDIISSLSQATDFDNRSAIHRNKVLNTLRSKGVTFTDIQSALIKVYKDEGVYKKSLISGKMKYVPFTTLIQQRVKWAHDIRRFMVYVKKTYVSYDKLKADVPKKVQTEEEQKGVVYRKNMDAIATLMEFMKSSHNSEAIQILSQIESIIKITA